MTKLFCASRLAQLLFAGMILGWVGSASAQDPGGLSLPVPLPIPMPEPGTLVLLGSGLVGLAGAGWRRSRRK